MSKLPLSAAHPRADGRFIRGGVAVEHLGAGVQDDDALDGVGRHDGCGLTGLIPDPYCGVSAQAGRRDADGYRRAVAGAQAVRNGDLDLATGGRPEWQDRLGEVVRGRVRSARACISRRADQEEGGGSRTTDYQAERSTGARWAFHGPVASRRWRRRRGPPMRGWRW